MTLYSLKILKESFTEASVLEHKLFEESVVLTNSFQENSSEDYQKKILKKISNQEPEYKNQYGEKVSWKAVLIVDVYELDFKLNGFEDYCEVFSRFIEMPSSATVQDVIKKFYSDYVWGTVVI